MHLGSQVHAPEHKGIFVFLPASYSMPCHLLLLQAGGAKSAASSAVAGAEDLVEKEAVGGGWS